MSHKVLDDSDAFIGWIVATDQHHYRAEAAFEQLRQERLQPITTNLVIAETASLLSRRYSLQQARTFLNISQKLDTIYISEELHHSAVRLFLEQQRTNTTFVDMCNVVVMKQLSLSAILSFDVVYTKDFDLHSVA